MNSIPEGKLRAVSNSSFYRWACILAASTAALGILRLFVFHLFTFYMLVFVFISLAVCITLFGVKKGKPLLLPYIFFAVLVLFIVLVSFPLYAALQFFACAFALFTITGWIKNKSGINVAGILFAVGLLLYFFYAWMGLREGGLLYGASSPDFWTTLSAPLNMLLLDVTMLLFTLSLRGLEFPVAENNKNRSVSP